MFRLVFFSQPQQWSSASLQHITGYIVLHHQCLLHHSITYCITLARVYCIIQANNTGSLPHSRTWLGILHHSITPLVLTASLQHISQSVHTASLQQQQGYTASFRQTILVVCIPLEHNWVYCITQSHHQCLPHHFSTYHSQGKLPLLQHSTRVFCIFQATLTFMGTLQVTTK